MKRRNYLILLCLALTLTIAATSASAATITVRQDGSGDYTSVAVAVAVSSVGDTIEIGPGTYTEQPIVVSHGLTLISTDGAAATVLDGQGSIRILRMETGIFTVEGLRFTNANNPSFGAVTAVSNADVTFRDCIFDNNTEGGFTAASNATGSLYNCEFTNNSSALAPGGIYTSGAEILLTDCRFTGNGTNFRGGAVSIVNGSVATVTGCTFSGNAADVDGGALYVEASTATVDGCLFEGNSGAGGAMYILDASGSVTGNTLYNNAEDAPSKGAIYVESSSINLDRNIISSHVGGPGIMVSGGLVDHSCNLYWANAGGPIVGSPLSPSEVQADPLFCDVPGGNFSVSSLGPAAAANSPCGQLIGARPTGCSIPPPPHPSGTRITVRQDGSGDYLSVAVAMAASAPGDTIEIGPGTYVEPSMVVAHDLVLESTAGAAQTVLDGQGAIRILRLESAVYTVDGIRFTNARNLNFGALTVVFGAVATIRDCIFDNNVECGFTVASGATSNLINCQFIDNVSAVAPGAVYASGANLIMTGCEFTGNSTQNRGGAVNARLGGAVTIADCTFDGNSAGQEGGALFFEEAGALDVTGSLFRNNTGLGSAVYVADGFGIIANNTLFANDDPGGYATLFAESSIGLTVDKNIFAAETGAVALGIVGGPLDHACNIYWGNFAGAISGEPLDPSERVSDPIFCDAANGDFTVSGLGPAVWLNSPCGELVGAFPEGCSIPPSDPTRIRVRQDGSGDYTTVFDAVAASTAGDTIEVGPGTYAPPSMYVSHSLTLESTDGPAATVLSGQVGAMVLRFIGGPQGCRVEGFTFTQGYRDTWIAILMAAEGTEIVVDNCVFDDNDCAGMTVGSGSDAVIRGCTFSNNHESIAGTGGAYISGLGTTALVEDCRFENNTTAGAGGGTSVVAGAVATIVNCEYVNNDALLGGAIHCGEGSTADFSGCLFAGNSGIGAVAYYFRSAGVIETSTLYDNTATTSPLGAILFHETTSASAVRNIIAETHNGPGIWADFGATVDCCVFWNNTFGSVSGASPTNSVEADPLFCDPASDDFTVSGLGPAAPANSLCGQSIGAFPVGCDIVPPPTSARIRVRQDGSGDYTTVFDAVAASTAGDTIDVGPGTYTSPEMYIHHTLVFESTDGAAATVLSGQVDGLIMRFVDAARNCRVEGFTFTQASRGTSTISALAVSFGSQVAVENCIFDGNSCSGFGMGSGCDAVIRNCTFTNNVEAIAGTGGAYISGLGTTALVEDCRFEGNITADAGGGTAVVAGAVATIVDCEYLGNSALLGGAIHCGEDATANFSGCLFAGNSGIGAAMYYYRSAGLIEGNTFYNNTATSTPLGTVLIQDTQGVTLTRNIVAHTSGGTGLSIYAFSAPASATETCNVFWGNDLGPVSGQVLSPLSVQADPIFCDPDNGVYTVSSLGAAAPDNSPCGQLVGAFPVDCAIEPPVPVGDEPVIISILDVPNDQGRQVRIKWLRSGQDEAGTDYTITGYAIYRYQEMIAGSSPLTAPPPLDVPRGKGSQIDGWDYLVTVPARGDSVYQTTVETLCDARPNKLCSTAFFVSAMTPDPLVYFDSAPDSGYSVDNLPPGPPSNLVASVANPGIHLNWTAPDEPDIECYRVYRSSQPDFALDESNLVAEIVDTEWDDATGSALYQYKVTVMDDGGNESEPAGVNTPTPVGPASRVFALQQNVPNPFNPTTVIPYNVGVGGGHVTLRVYDVAGRLVTTLVDEVQSPGPKAMQWDGRDRSGQLAASGTYFYRLTGPGFEKTLKMTLVQ